jgi:hypothetical protein
LTPSAIADPAPIKISAKVPMNSAANARTELLAVSLTGNYLQTWLLAKITGLPFTYIAGYRAPVNLSESP